VSRARDTANLVHGAAASTNIADADELVIWDTTASAYRKQLRSNVVGKLGLVLQSVQTGTFSATSGKIYPIDCTSGAATMTLPSATGTLGIIGYVKYGTYPLTLSGTVNGSSNGLSITGEGLDTIIDSSSSRGWV